MPPGCASVSCVTALGGNGFSYPEAVAVGPNGNLYVADTYNNAVDVMPANCMSTSCVTSLGGGYFYPNGVAADPSGNVYVADSFNNAIEVLASTCTSASCVMPLGSGYNNPEGVWLDGAGNAFISDSYNNQIKKLDRVDGPSLSFGSSNVYSSPGAQTATLTNIGTSALTFAVPSSGQNPTVPAEFSLGNTSTCPVLEASSSTAATLASSASCTLSVSFAPTTTGSVSGSVVLGDNSLNNASATQAIPVSGTGTLRTATLGTVSFSPASSEPNGTPQAVTLSVTLSYTVVAPTGTVTFVLNGVNYTATCTSAGSPETCTATVPATTIATLAVNSYTVTAAMAADINYNPTTATSATFKITAVASTYTAPNEPVGTTSATQTAYVNITTAGTTSATLGTAVQVLTTGITGLDYAYVTGGSCAANTAYTAGQACTVEYTFTPRAPGARLGAVVISSGTTVLGTSYLAGTVTGPLAVIAPGAISTVAGNGSAGYVASQDTGTTAATAAELNSPAAVALDAAGNLYIADTNNNRIRKVTAATGDITTVAGNGTAGYDASQDTGTTLATAAELNSPYSVAIDGAGNLYIADLNNNRVRKVAAATGFISTVAGNGIQGAGSSLYSPQGVAVDAAGNLYIADWGNSRVRKVVLTTGSISTVAGNGTYGYVPSQDTGTTLATNAELSAPTAIAVDASGNLYIADSNNQRIRKVTASTGYISTVAGNGTAGYVASQDTGTTLATAAEIDEPEGVSVDAAGNLYIGDYMNHRIRKVTATGYISTVAGNGTTLYTASQDTGTTAANATSLDFPRGATPDAAGNLYIADQSHERIRLVTASSATLTFGATAVGSSSAQQVVTLSNNGFSTALTVSSLTAGNVNANFSGAGTTCSTSSSLAAGAVCNLGVVLAPTVIATPFTASAVVTDNSLNNTGATQTVPINVDVATFGTMSFSPAATVAAGTSQAITISDTVNYNGAQPSGAVTFVLNGVSYPATCSPGLPENCTATVPAATIAALPGNTYTVTVALATDSNYYATTGTSGTFTVTATTPTISFTIPEKHAADAPFQVTATSNSAGAITYSLVSGPATVSTSGLVTLSGTAGTVQITASQAANGSYAAGSTTASFLAAVGSVWVVNGGGSVSLFDLAGNAFASSASTGGGLGAVSAPGTIAFDASGNAWIASTSGISEFNFDGTPVTLTANTSGGVSSPSGVAVDGAGSVWVSNANGTVSQLSNSGVAISPVAGYPGTSTTATGGVAIDLSGNVWISNTTANTITELIGAATPTAPAATALANGTTGGRP